MENIRIREVCLRDVPKVLAIAQASFAEEMAFWGFNRGKARAALCLYGPLWALQKLRRKPFFQFYVAEAERKVVGGAMVEWHKGFAYLQSVMVHPEFRGRGIGRRLVSHAVDEAFRFGAKKVVLHVRTSNAPARRLYESLGFRPFEERVFLVRETKAIPVTKSWPPGLRLARALPWDSRGWKIAEAVQEPAARAVYGPPKPPSPLTRGLMRLFSPLSPKAWLLVEANGHAVARLSLSRGNPARLSVHLLPEIRGRGLEETLLAFGARQAQGKRLILCASVGNAPLIQAALALGFQEKMRDIGMVLERGG